MAPDAATRLTPDFAALDALIADERKRAAMVPDAATILALEDRRFQAMIAQDFTALDALIADDLRFVHSNGVVEDKAEFLRKLRTGERRYLRYAALVREIRQEGGFSFVFGEADAEIARPGGGIATRMTYTAIYRNAPEPRLFAWHSVKSPTP